MINLESVKEEAHTILEYTKELSIKYGDIFHDLNKDESISALNLLFDDLKYQNKKSEFFSNTVSYLSNYWAMYESQTHVDQKASDVSLKIRQIILLEIRELIKPIEKKHNFSLKDELPKFEQFLTGVEVIEKNNELLNKIEATLEKISDLNERRIEIQHQEQLISEKISTFYTDINDITPISSENEQSVPTGISVSCTEDSTNYIPSGESLIDDNLQFLLNPNYGGSIEFLSHTIHLDTRNKPFGCATDWDNRNKIENITTAKLTKLDETLEGGEKRAVYQIKIECDDWAREAILLMSQEGFEVIDLDEQSITISIQNEKNFTENRALSVFLNQISKLINGNSKNRDCIDITQITRDMIDRFNTTKIMMERFDSAQSFDWSKLKNKISN